MWVSHSNYLLWCLRWTILSESLSVVWKASHTELHIDVQTSSDHKAHELLPNCVEMMTKIPTARSHSISSMLMFQFQLSHPQIHAIDPLLEASTIVELNIAHRVSSKESYFDIWRTYCHAVLKTTTTLIMEFLIWIKMCWWNSLRCESWWFVKTYTFFIEVSITKCFCKSQFGL